MKNLGTPISLFLIVIATALVSLLVGVAIGSQINGNRVLMVGNSPSLDIPVPDIENVDEMLVEDYRSCKELENIIIKKPIEYGSSYAKKIDDNRLLYFEISERKNQNFNVYLFENNKDAECLTKMDELPSTGPGGYYEYTPIIISPSIVSTLNKDADLRASWEDTRYYNIDERVRVLKVTVSSNYSISFDDYTLRPSVELVAEGNDPCGFGNFIKTPVTITLSDFELNQSSLGLLSEKIVYQGTTPEGCKPISLESYSVDTSLNSATVSYGDAGTLNINLSPIYSGNEPTVSISE